MSERDGRSGSASLFVARPILSLVLNLIVVIAGLAALVGVEVRELPDVDQPVISVRAEYPGAAPSTVDNAVTDVLEDALSALEGLRTISATSSYGRSRLTLEMQPGVDINIAANEARELVAGASRNLPDDLEEPIVSKNDANADPIIRLSVSGPASLEELTNWADGIISDRLAAVPGVAEGRACVVTDPLEPGDLGPGDILIAPLTDPAWTPLFVPVEAVVVDVGGQMSHAVIVAREFGMPCVVAAADASKRIPHGAHIRVDADAGTVTVLDH